MKHHFYSCGRYLINKATRISRKQMIACCVLALSTFHFPLSASAQDTVRRLDEVIISTSRADNKTPLTTSTIDQQELDDARANISMPYMLETQTSVVASGENGGVGAAYIRIRGVDASRINVNINGITLNDPESQQVYWYNIPNLGGMAQSLQIQRGVGASTGGSPAFGAAINLQTLNARQKAYGEADLGYGSWNTRQYSITTGTGILKSGLSFDFAYSGLTSDGYVRSWGTNQQSFFGSASWYSKKTIIKLITIIGSQTTGITWDGAYDYQLDEDPTYNPSGEYEMDGNIMYYPNETDNYWQRHYQLYVSHFLTDRWSIHAALDYTHGDGYYEQYKAEKKFSKYGLSQSGKSDFVTRKQMDNDALTGNLALHYNGEKHTFSLGNHLLYFDGYHFGNVLWCRDTAAHISDYEWYRYNGTKVDNAVFAKATYDFTDDLNAYADLQLRTVNYKLRGDADDLFTMDFDQNYLFFNPKAGINFRLNDHQRTYFVAGISNREPTKSDIKDAIGRNDTVKAETMLDLELGYQLTYNRWAFNVNLYGMFYRDQLTPSGDLSSSGYALMENVDHSYRIGVEFEGGYKFTEWFRFDANLTLSQNKVLDYTFADFADGDTDPNLVTRTTDLALSPNIVGAAIATFVPVKDAKLQLIGKYVGKQYADNTSRECYAITPYFLLNVKASYTWHLKGANEIEAQLLVNNLLDHHYRLSAWVGDWVDDWSGPDPAYYYHSRAFLQQPGCNFMARVIYRF
jgi:iron complex outermembrane receptor protein